MEVTGSESMPCLPIIIIIIIIIIIDNSDFGVNKVTYVV